MATVRMSEKEAIARGIIPPPAPTQHEFDTKAQTPNPAPELASSPTPPSSNAPKPPRRQPDMSARVPAILPHSVGTYSRPPGNQQVGDSGWKLSIAPTTLGRVLLALISWLIGFACGLKVG